MCDADWHSAEGARRLLVALEPYRRTIVIGVFLLLSMFQALIGVDINLFARDVTRSADAIIQVILHIAGFA